LEPLDARFVAGMPCPFEKLGRATLGTSSTDEAHAAIWRGILRVARHLSNRTPLPIKPNPLLVRLRNGTAEIPVYFIGLGLWEFNLAQSLLSENSVFAIEVPWPSAWRIAAIENRVAALPAMEQLVAPYVSALAGHARSSRCVLAGSSFHGLMAFEVAHQLNKRGGKAEMVLLLDSKASYPPPHKVAWQKLRTIGISVHNSSTACGTSQTRRTTLFRNASLLPLLRWMIVEELKSLWRRFIQPVSRGELTTKCDNLGIPLHWALVQRVYSNAVKSYRLHRLDSCGVLFRAESKEERPARALDGSLGWDGLFGNGLEIIQMTGDHLTMTQQPHNLRLAREMSNVLNRFSQHHQLKELS
jgi:thioesterase domain-containing protein